MALNDSLKKEYCFCPLKGDTKMEVLNNLVHQFAMASDYDSEREREILDAVLKRESLGSTGLEHGVAIPHAKVDFITESSVALAVGEKEIDYDAADGKPTNIYFLVLGSDKNPSAHVQLLSQIAMVVKNNNIMRLIRNAKSKEDLISIFF